MHKNYVTKQRTTHIKQKRHLKKANERVRELVKVVNHLTDK